MNRFPFKTAYTHLRDFYGLELKPDEFETMAISGWDHIGNKEYRLYRMIVEPVEECPGRYIIELPCNADILEAITTTYEDVKSTSSGVIEDEVDRGGIENSIEIYKTNTNPLYISGTYIKYLREGDKIIVFEPYNKVQILYKGVLLDDEGLPYINEKEVDAIAAFCAFADTRKKALMTRDGNLFSLAQALEANWKMKCTQARIPDYFSQNDMDEILNVRSSWDRKRYGKSYKPLR